MSKNFRLLVTKSFHDGLVDIQFSDPRRGLHGCTPAEILHAMQLGIEERAIEACFGAKRIKKRSNRSLKRKRGSSIGGEDTGSSKEDDTTALKEEDEGDDLENEEDVTDNEEDDNNDDKDNDNDEDEEDEDKDEKTMEVMEALNESDTSRNNVFNKEAMQRVDTMAKQFTDT